MTNTRLLGLMLVCLAPPSASGGEGIKSDLYGDPLPPGAVARLGTIRLRHAYADVVFSKDGKQLISCDWDGEIRFWDAVTGKRLRYLRLPCKPQKPGQFEIAYLSPDGRWAARDGKTVVVYDAATGKERLRIPTNGPGHISYASLTFSPDGKTLAVQRPGDAIDPLNVQLWDIAEGKKVRALTTFHHCPSLWAAVFSPDGRRLAGIDPHSTIRLFDTIAGKEIGPRENRPQMKANSLAFSPDSKTLAVGVNDPGKVLLLDASTLRERSVVQAPAEFHAHHITDLTFSPDGRWLAGTFGDFSDGRKEWRVLIQDMTGEKLMRRLPGLLDGRIRLAFTPAGETLAGKDTAGSEIRLWDVPSGRLLPRRFGHDRPVRTLAVSPDGRTIASGDDLDPVLRLWDAVTGKQLRVLKNRGLGFTLCGFSPDAKRVFAASQTSLSTESIAFQVWDVATAKELRRVNLAEEGSFTRLFGISTDGRHLAANAARRSISGEQLVIWDTDEGKIRSARPFERMPCVRVWPNGGKTYESSSAHATFAPDGESAVVWLGDRLGLQEISTGSRLASLPKNVGPPLIFSPDGRYLAASTWHPGKEDPHPGEVWKGPTLLEAASGEEIVRLDLKDIEYVAFAIDGRGVIIADRESLRVLDAATGERLAQRAWPDEVRLALGGTKIHSLAALPGGRVATGMFDGEILVWDATPATKPIGRRLPELDRTQLDALWSDLAGPAAKAHRVIPKLAAAPRQMLPLLRERLQPVTLDMKHIEKLLTALDGDDFSARQAASRELAQLRYRIEPMLRRALQGKPSLETRRRIEAILAEPKRPPAETLRTLRAIAVLERIGTPDARSILEKLSGGAAVRETQEARAALQRLRHR